MDPSIWSNEQNTLFDVLSHVCGRLGKEGAQEIVNAINDRPVSESISTQWHTLKQTSVGTALLRQQNKELETALATSQNECESLRADLRQTLSLVTEVQDKTRADWEQRLRESVSQLQANNDLLRKQLQSTIEAQRVANVKLAKIHKNRGDWVAYADSLQKRLEKREAQMAERGLLHGPPYKAVDGNNGRPMSVTSRETAKPSEVPEEVAGELLPPLQKASGRIRSSTAEENLDGDTLLGSLTPKAAEGGRQSLGRSGAKVTPPALPRTDSQIRRMTFETPSVHSAAAIAANRRESVIEGPASPELPRFNYTFVSRDQDGFKVPGKRQPVPELEFSSTQGEPDDEDDVSMVPQQPAAVESQSSPQVVSERPVRRPGRRSTIQPAVESPKHVRVKPEPTSPIMLAEVGVELPQESMDLDIDGPRRATPRKQRYLPVYQYTDSSRQRHSREEDEEDELSMAPEDLPQPKPKALHPSQISPSAYVRWPSGGQTQQSQQTSVLQPQSINSNKRLQSADLSISAAKRTRLDNKARAAEILGEDGENGQPGVEEVPKDKTARLRDLLEKPVEKWSSGAFGAKNLNKTVQVSRRKSARADSQRSQQLAEEQRSPSVDSLNAEAYSPETEESSQTAAISVASQQVNKLKAEIAKNIPAKAVNGKWHCQYADCDWSAKSKEKLRNHAQRHIPCCPNCRATGFSSWEEMRKHIETMHVAASKAANGQGDTQVSEYGGAGGVSQTDRPENEPLRARPLHKLTLNDFKVNPDYNGGFDYAFTDVVRGRDQRKCLPGCTNASCCGGKFEMLAELALANRPPVLSKEMIAEDDALLNEYFNDARKVKQLKQKGKEAERRAALVKAKARKLANETGRHRHAYERRRTPPGFWRTDFPSTQEVAEDRREARDHERALVRKRYEEAVRGGGAWVFRDE